jgi:2-phosphosulfolactate phosphatase
VFERDIEVFLTASSLTAEDIKGRTVVAIDVLRASTTISTALANGAREVIPVPDLGEAGRIASALDSDRYLLCGERGGQKIEGYALGNSPTEFTREVVDGKTLILSTTNGTPAILAAMAAEEVLIGGFVNVRAVTEAVRQADRDVTIVCAGWHHRVSLEDTLCAGMIVSLLLRGESPADLSDTVYMALWQYKHDEDDLSLPIGRCNHARRLVKLGHGDDIAICIGVDTIGAVPRLREQRLVLASSGDITRLAPTANLSSVETQP